MAKVSSNGGVTWSVFTLRTKRFALSDHLNVLGSVEGMKHNGATNQRVLNKIRDEEALESGQSKTSGYSFTFFLILFWVGVAG
jgi:hypothetical protein